jgi:hypothetical protein
MFRRPLLQKIINIFCTICPGQKDSRHHICGLEKSGTVSLSEREKVTNGRAAPVDF